MAVITNKEILALAKSDPSFQSWTSKFSLEKLASEGYEAYAAIDNTLKGDFWNLIVQVYLGKVRGPEVRIPNTFGQIVERQGNPNGGQQRRIRTKIVKPTDPRYRNLVANGSVDPYVIRPLSLDEEYYKQNFDYANNLTITDTDAKKMFSDPVGFSTVLGMVFGSFAEAKDIQEFELIKEMISKIINDSTASVMQATQKIEVPELDNTSTDAEMAQFIQIFKNLHDMMTSIVYSGEFNCKGFQHGMDPANYVLFVRCDILNLINTTLMTTAFHTENLGIPFKVVGVKDFGGITYKKDVAGTLTEMIPCYSEGKGNLGEVLGYNASGDPDDPMFQINELIHVDPNEDVDAILVEKGALFITEQNNYQTGAVYNPAGLYTNYWAAQPNKGINYDASYDVIKFYHSSTSHTFDAIKKKSVKKVDEK